LRCAAQFVRNTFRPEDMVARVGGDEFVVVLPATDVPAALQAVDRLKIRLKDYNQNCPSSLTLNLSVGVATGDSHSQLRDVFNQADQAMYREKTRKKIFVESQ
jgi:diguanylate cyclase (GGDEF)-like protein